MGLHSNCWVNLQVLGQPCEFYPTANPGRRVAREGLGRAARRGQPALLVMGSRAIQTPLSIF
jgi:hypothetical protein